MYDFDFVFEGYILFEDINIYEL